MKDVVIGSCQMKDENHWHRTNDEMEILCRKLHISYEDEIC